MYDILYLFVFKYHVDIELKQKIRGNQRKSEERSTRARGVVKKITDVTENRASDGVLIYP